MNPLSLVCKNFRAIMPLTVALSASALLGGNAFAQANQTSSAVTKSYELTTQIANVQPRNWSILWTNPSTDPLTVPRFDPSLGTLQSVTVRVTSDAVLSLGVENQDMNQGRSHKARLSLDTRLRVGDEWAGPCLVTPIPVCSVIKELTPWDGTTDFNGTSGYTFTNECARTEERTLDEDEAAYFIGTGDVPLFYEASRTYTMINPLTYTASSSVTGNIKITYTYIPASQSSAATPASPPAPIRGSFAPPRAQ